MGTVTASCGHVLEDGEDTVSVRNGHESCDAVDGFSACVEYHSYCPACAERAKSWDTYLAPEVPDEWWYRVGYPAWRAKINQST
jgi:hypothetical protein